MKLAKELKYEMLPAQKISVRNQPWGSPRYPKGIKLRRIKALVDIPLHKVKAGDLGGYVQHKFNLSHDDESWIGGGSIVAGLAIVKDNALVTDNACVYGQKAPAFGTTFAFEGNVIYIQDFSQIRDNAMADALGMYGFRVAGTTVLRDSAYTSGELFDWDLSGESSVTTSLYGNNLGRILSGKDRINYNEDVKNYRTITPDGIRLRLEALQAGECVPDPMVTSMHPVELLAIKTGYQSGPELSDEDAEIFRMVNHVESEYESYTHDIVNLIRYPLLADMDCEPTREFAILLRRVQRIIADGGVPDLDSVMLLESRFVEAEGNARKAGSARLPEADRKALEKTSHLIMVASDEAATENEKQMAFKQVFKQLEGFVDVPDVAKEIFRVKIGLRELTA